MEQNDFIELIGEKDHVEAAYSTLKWLTLLLINNSLVIKFKESDKAILKKYESDFFFVNYQDDTVSVTCISSSEARKFVEALE